MYVGNAGLICNFYFSLEKKKLRKKEYQRLDSYLVYSAPFPCIYRKTYSLARSKCLYLIKNNF